MTKNTKIILWVSGGVVLGSAVGYLIYTNFIKKDKTTEKEDKKDDKKTEQSAPRPSGGIVSGLPFKSEISTRPARKYALPIPKNL